MKYDVFGMCNPLFDIQAEVNDQILDQLGYQKGGMFLIEHEQQRKLVPTIYDMIVNTEAGGSGANTMIGLAMLGGKTVYTGHVGDDEHGRLYRAGLEKIGVKPNLGMSSGNTGISLILVSPDAQRTMCTYLGRCQNLSKKDVVAEDIENSQYIYVTGYLWDTDPQKEAVLHAMEIANQSGVKVALSLSDPFCVSRHKADFLRLIKDHVSVLFGNFQEAMELTDTNSPTEAVNELAKHCDVAVVTLDAEGSLIQQGTDLHKIPPYRVNAVDTTGAGDMYAAGLLYGLTRNLPLEQTGRIASYVAAKVVAKLGPRLEEIDLKAIQMLENGAQFSELTQ